MSFDQPNILPSSHHSDTQMVETMSIMRQDAGNSALNSDDQYSLFRVHALPEILEQESELTMRLEYSWDMEYLGLCEDQPDEFILDKTLYNLFVHEKVSLIPEDDIIRTYREACQRQAQFPVIKGEQFNYRFIAHSDVQLFRHSDIAVDLDDPNSVATLTHPYTDCFTSRIQPRFAIVNCGLKLGMKELDKFRQEDEELGATLFDISYIFRKWATKIPPEGFAKNDSDDDLYDAYEGKDALEHAARSLARARVRVDHATKTLSQGIDTCLIQRSEHGKDGASVDYVHLLPRNLPYNFLENLGSHWHMPEGSFNINSRYNILRLGTAIHRLFDQGLLLLLPKATTLKTYIEAATEGKFPKIKEPNYEYRLLGHPDIKDFVIHRREATAYKDYAYPYTDFPPVKSHVHPRFVICHAGQALFGAYGILYRNSYPELGEMIEQVVTIYEGWAPKWRRF